MVSVPISAIASIVAAVVVVSVITTVVPKALQDAQKDIVAGQGIALQSLSSSSVLVQNTGVVQVVLPSEEYTATLIDGVLYVSKVPVAQGNVLIGPVNGTGEPTFRPLVDVDLPSQIAAEKIFGILQVDQGGTGSGTPVTGGNLMISTIDGAIIEGPNAAACCAGSGEVVIEAGDGIGVDITGNTTYTISTSGITPVSKGGTGSGSALVGDRVMLSDGTGQSMYESSPLFDGYLLVGSTGSAPVSTTLNAGDGVIIGTGPGVITVSATGTCAVNQTFSHTCLDISGETCTTPVSDTCIPQALSLTSLGVSGTTTLGTTTTCDAPLNSNCIEISSHTCPGGALGSNCIPADLVLNSLYVTNLVAVNSSQQTIIDANVTVLHVDQINADNIQLNGTLECVAQSGAIAPDCVDISNKTCPGGALDASCLPSDVVFHDVQSTGALTVNTVTCLGGAIPDNCVDISGKTCTSTLSANCIPLRIGTINSIAPDSGTQNFGVTAGTGVVITPAANGIVVGNTGVTSVALAMPSLFDVTGSPVTTTGTLTASLATQSANTVFAGPVTGADAAPTFRALDITDLNGPLNAMMRGGTSATLNSATATLLDNNLSVIPTAGRYWVLFTGSIINSGTSCVYGVSIYVNGNLYGASEVKYGSNVDGTVTTQTTAWVDGVKAIEMYWRRISGSCSSTMTNFNMQTVRVRSLA